MTYLNSTERALLRQRLTDLANAFGSKIPPAYKSGVLDVFDISESTYERELRIVRGGGQPTPPLAAWQHRPQNLHLLAQTLHPTLKQAHAAFRAADPLTPADRAHWARTLRKQIGNDVFAKYRKGVQGGKISSPCISIEEETFFSRLAGDTKDCHVLITPDNCWAPGAAHTVTWMAGGRYIAACAAFVGDVNADQVMAVLGQAIHHIGGLPEYVHTDNGSENLASRLRRWLLMNGGAMSHSAAYYKDGNAKVERWHLDLETWAQGLGRSTHSPTDHTEQPFHRDSDPVNTQTQFNDLLQEQVREHNERVHGGTGRRPVDDFEARGPAPQPVEPAALAELALPDPSPRKTKIMNRRGLMLNNTYYTNKHGKLAGRVGDRFLLRHWPTDDSVIYVFEVNGTFLCEATPAKTQGSAYRRDTAEHNATINKQVDADMRAGAKAAQERSGASTTPPADFDGKRMTAQQARDTRDAADTAPSDSATEAGPQFGRFSAEDLASRPRPRPHAAPDADTPGPTPHGDADTES